MIIIKGTISFGNFMTFEKDALGKSSIFDFRLSDVDGIVIKMIVDDTVSDSVVLTGIFMNSLLEVAFEA